MTSFPTPPSDDAPLIRLAAGGDIEAFGPLVLRHQSAVRSCLAARMDSPDQADDLAQETFLIAFRRLAEFNPCDPLGPWLRTIALNLLRNYQRKFRAESIGSQHDLEQLVAGRLEQEWQLQREDARVDALRECLALMDGPGRELVKGRYGDGLSIRELTDRFGLAHSALTMRLHRLRASLAACVTGKINPPTLRG